MSQTNASPYRSSFMKEEAQKAWDYFNKMGYPSPQNESWRFSNPSPWLLQSASLAAEGEFFSKENFSTYIIPDTIPILILNDTISIPDNLPEGLQIMEMARSESEIQRNIGSVVDYRTSLFSAENTALFKNGIIINISENTMLEKPLQLIHSIKGNADSRIYPRIYVNVGANSQIEIIQNFQELK